MLQTFSGVCMPLGTWVEIEVHSYYALIYVCVGGCMCLYVSRASYAHVQATVGVGTVLIWYFGVAYTRGEGYPDLCQFTLALIVDGGFLLNWFINNRKT